MSKQKIGMIGFFMSLIALFAVISVGAALPPEISTLEAEAVVADGNYYLNSEMGEQFLRRVSNSEIGISVYYASPAIKWTFEGQSDGTFLIRSTYRNTYALYASGSTASLALVPETLTNNYKWRVYTGASGGVLLMNAATGTYLSCDGTTLGLMSKPLASSSTYSRIVWRMPMENSYVNLESFSISYYELFAVDETQSCNMVIAPTNATWKNSNNFMWSSSDSAVVTVSSNGDIVAQGAGTATITAVHKATGKNASISVAVNESEAGVYYISLFDLDSTMTASGTNGNTVFLDSFDALYTCEWILTERGGGYYTIEAGDPQDHRVLTISNGNLRLQEYQYGNPAQHWVLDPQPNGRYNIRSQTNLRLKYNENSGQVVQITVGGSGDEWTVVQPYDASLIALPGDAERSSYFSDIAQDLSAMNYANVYNNHTYRPYGISRDELLTYMANSKITLLRTHGDTGSIYISDDASLTASYLLGLENEWLFEKSELIIYGACLTGAIVDEEKSLVAATFECGARSVIGFQNPTNTHATNEWSEKFFEKLSYYAQNPYLQKSLTDICNDLNSEAEDEDSDFFYKDVYHYTLNGVLVSLRNYVIAGSTDLPGSN